MKKTAQIRKSLHKPYWYDRTNGDHINNIELLVSTNLPVTVAIVLGLLYNPWFLYALGLFVVLVVIIFKWYNNNFDRYFRLIKRIEKRGHKENIFYVVQSSILAKKNGKPFVEEGVKWKDCETFYSNSGKEEAAQFFDQKTIKKEVGEQVLSDVMKSVHKPNKVYGKFREKNNISKKEETLFISVFLLPILATFFVLLLVNPVITVCVFGFVVLCLILVYAYYVRSEKRFLRVIERTEEQGRYRKTTYHIQSFITKMDLNDVVSDNSLKWKDYYPYGLSEGDTRLTVFSHFEKETIENIVVEKVL